MLRHALPLAVATTLGALAAGPSGCRTTTCTLLACDSVHASVSAHLPLSSVTLFASRTTVCWREVCADLVAMSDAGQPSAIAFDSRTSLLLGDAAVSPEGEGGTLLQLELRFFTRGRSGDFVYTRQANGDRYRVTVVDAAGKVLFDAEQLATYDESFPNGPECDPEPCRHAKIELFAR